MVSWRRKRGQNRSGSRGRWSIHRSGSRGRRSIHRSGSRGGRSIHRNGDRGGIHRSGGRGGSSIHRSVYRSRSVNRSRSVYGYWGSISCLQLVCLMFWSLLHRSAVYWCWGSVGSGKVCQCLSLMLMLSLRKSRSMVGRGRSGAVDRSRSRTVSRSWGGIVSRSWGGIVGRGRSVHWCRLFLGLMVTEKGFPGCQIGALHTQNHGAQKHPRKLKSPIISQSVSGIAFVFK